MLFISTLYKGEKPWDIHIKGDLGDGPALLSFPAVTSSSYLCE